MLKISDEWQFYKLLDCGNGEKLEYWNGVLLRRPDPQAMWNVNNYDMWHNVNAFYERKETGGGSWQDIKDVPESWTIGYKNLTFKLALTNFKHTGLFPEQAVNWDYMINKIKSSKRKIKVLNLFAYTGAATMACSSAGADVTQVDASKGMTEWAKENMKLNKLENNKIRFIVDDCLKFVEREARRGNKYDAIVMDPPSFGRGPKKEVWKFEDSLYKLIDASLNILSNKPLFFLINSYTTGISNMVLDNILKTTVLKKYPNGKVESGELALPVERDNMLLPCGIYGLWEE
ncbi:MAG TPA: class I SAM-dependent methyltransferase [Bacilli bacterium]|nr:class I SAM-dependent methyltransferase [Bacilli bacterium]